MFDIHQTIHNESGEINQELVQTYIDELAEEFSKSAEAKPLLETAGEAGYTAALMMRYALDFLGVTPLEMTVRDFKEVLFEIIPRKVSVPPEKAPQYVAELRAFWSFLQRQYSLQNAEIILHVLENDCAEKLRRELANPANYGMAKSFVMAGMKAGFDMTTQEGTEAFMLMYNSRLQPPLPLPLPNPFLSALDNDRPPAFPPNTSTPKERAQKRKATEAKQQARKKNRRK